MANYDLSHSGRPKDEEPHIKRSVKKKKENIEYIVRVNLKELGIDETSFDELQELFRMFDNDKDGVLSLKEFEKILSVLGRSGKTSSLTIRIYQLSSQLQKIMLRKLLEIFLLMNQSSVFPSMSISLLWGSRIKALNHQLKLCWNVLKYLTEMEQEGSQRFTSEAL